MGPIPGCPGRMSGDIGWRAPRRRHGVFDAAAPWPGACRARAPSRARPSAGVRCMSMPRGGIVAAAAARRPSRFPPGRAGPAALSGRAGRGVDGDARRRAAGAARGAPDRAGRGPARGARRGARTPRPRPRRRGRMPRQARAAALIPRRDAGATRRPAPAAAPRDAPPPRMGRRRAGPPGAPRARGGRRAPAAPPRRARTASPRSRTATLGRTLPGGGGAPGGKRQHHFDAGNA